MPGPTLLEAVKDYLTATGTTATEDAIKDALAAEKANQARVCRVDPANYPDDLAQALKRRVARNLAMRNLPLGVMSDELGATRLGSNDPEVRRLEKPFKKLVMG